ncbi:hypothetical protein ABEF92_003586 [Exophiala dermatitidis]|uniref:Cytochrome c oxidase subunit XI assembly protein n=1 Tax=Exophiala dermatitidis (strain ATCC 34100 / CBS 525.76 / NIH/UT8656) TaxID=858893 RepID=H6BWA8_EXODN|nr:cytochrome c oxidase subunit XI assembly protein [Exophiala dermatitidis NIH/UT8656]EHY56024.1 cytochrome c oxidase subunit XI assembly protein [Exophiala dermatitidis NIH/UT8656]
MLSRARPTGPLHHCHYRQDIQTLLERGFCGPAVSLRVGLSASGPFRCRQRAASPQPGQHVRAFTKAASKGFRTTSKTSSPSTAGPKERSNPETTAADTPPVLDAHALDTLQELENALGRSIDEAIQDDRREHTAAFDSVASLRASGASLEEVVRRARQVHGDSLPDSVLEDAEFKIYRRLYGDPAAPEGDEFVDEDDLDSDDSTPANQLFDREGTLVDYSLYEARERTHMEDASEQEQEDFDHLDSSEREGTDRRDPPRPVRGGIDLNLERDVTGSLLASPTHRAMEVARLLDGEVAEDMDNEEDVEEETQARFHPLTTLGKFATSPKTVFLSQEDFVRPVANIMKDFSNKHLKETCEKTFGGPGLPHSPLTPRSGRTKPQIPIPLDVTQHSMGEMEANAFLTTVMPPTYAAIMSVLVETRKRLGSTWLNQLLSKEGGPRVLDAGAGGAGILAWREIVKAHWDSMHSSDRDPPPCPASKSVVLTGSDTLRHRAAALLDNTTFVPRLPDYVHTRDAPTLDDDRPAQPRKQFDVIIASHSLFGLQEEWMRKQHVQNLWSMLSSERGVLILIEKGVPRGFEAIGGARELLLERYIAVPKGRRTGYSAGHDSDDVFTSETGMIIAPCTNHEKCPMYHAPGMSQGRKDFCSFQQRYTRPSYLQRVLGAKDRNHDDVDFSYLSVMKGDDLRQRQLGSWDSLQDGVGAPLHPDPQVLGEDYEAWMRMCQSGFDEVEPGTTLEDTASTSLPAPWSLPRLVFTPMKRRGHVIMDVCTPAGKIERWTVPKSFGKQAYHDARKSQWGDLWALGAKTRISRSLRLGGPDTKEARRARSRKERLENQAEDLMEKLEQEKLAQMDEAVEFARDMGIADTDGVDVYAPNKKTKAKLEKSSNSTTSSKAQAAPTLPSSGLSADSDSGSFSFAFDDFDEEELNPVPPSKKASNGNGIDNDNDSDSLKSTTTTTTSSRHRNPHQVPDFGTGRYDDFAEENLRQMEAELADPLGYAAKGPRTMRTYSKFAVRSEKRRKAKVGRSARRGRSGL